MKKKLSKKEIQQKKAFQEQVKMFRKADRIAKQFVEKNRMAEEELQRMFA